VQEGHHCRHCGDKLCADGTSVPFQEEKPKCKPEEPKLLECPCGKSVYRATWGEDPNKLRWWDKRASLILFARFCPHCGAELYPDGTTSRTNECLQRIADMWEIGHRAKCTNGECDAC